jgi:hypothetical protein
MARAKRPVSRNGMTSRRKAAATSRRGRRVQRQIDRKGAKQKDVAPMQAGARLYPAPPLPAQHLKKPGREGALQLAPMYDAPHYIGSRKLEGMAALITGGYCGG